MLEYGIKFDFERQGRLGLDEAIYSEGKSPVQLRAIIDEAMRTGARRLFTRFSQAQFDTLSAEQRAVLDYDPTSRTAIVGEATRGRHRIARTAIVCAGSCDIPASREAARTLEYCGHSSAWIPDVGVAGLWRLLERVDELKDKDVVIVASGMEGALPSVVGGLVAGVVIALPTSIGYGVAVGGRAALSSALASCAPGLVVVNIDNGYGAACAALRALRLRSSGDT
mgnify:FL=1